MTTVCFVGAGSAEFTRQLLRDLLTYDDLGPLTLVLHDVDPRRLELAEGLARVAVERHGRTATIRATEDRAAAVSGADFVINAVNIGGHAATLTDFEVPARFGLRQTIADTLGAGGIFRGLRTFGFLDELATDILAEAPDAWLLNYTNPMAMNIQFAATRHPELKVLGLCHSVYWTVHDLCELIDVPFDDVSFHSAGVNHQAWVLRWERDGVDLYPELDRRIAADPELARRVRVDMYRRLGFYPTETSEHSAEYVPWYLHEPGEIERLRIPIDDYVGISARNLADVEALMPAVAAGQYVEPEEEAAEYAPQVIHSMVTGTARTIQATVRNEAPGNAGDPVLPAPAGLLIDNLPRGAAVEVPCRIDAAGAVPIPVGDLPAQCAALNRTFLSVVDLTVRAAMLGRPDHIRHALMADPNTAASLTVAEIWRLADEMVAAHGDRLPAPLRERLGDPSS
ncbi:alpha-galactosidase [Frankia sp. AgB1.9]|uniref:alpha-galactosidase n=1 Tax=unclassified Frankia TaxID=2632575 RepID=UPI001934972E|nr:MULTISPECIES: alpha-galactosidase [unclassified Frankia]MBL7487739.1 alpha-galactosidase [Frankia sp. AgW1.1]MBL7548018.1 alpha-galactosidase [Frankia sp. AgB1.9]MBL7622743.1 alpha-galactosidase [Frankia sp. AgB1.8]